MKLFFLPQRTFSRMGRRPVEVLALPAPARRVLQAERSGFLGEFGDHGGTGEIHTVGSLRARIHTSKSKEMEKSVCSSFSNQLWHHHAFSTGIRPLSSFLPFSARAASEASVCLPVCSGRVRTRLLPANTDGPLHGAKPCSRMRAQK